MKKQNGITLIALVITIIVLLILAAVSIAMLTGENGILTQAKNARTETTKAEAVEKINLELNAVKGEIYAQQANSSTYTPINNGKLDSAIVKILNDDGMTTDTGSGVYHYELNSTTLLITYYNNNKTTNIAEIKGTIDLSTSPYKITEAE